MSNAEWHAKLSLDELRASLTAGKTGDGFDSTLSLVLFYGSWCRKSATTTSNNEIESSSYADRTRTILTQALVDATKGLEVNLLATTVQVDDCDDTLEQLIGDGDSATNNNDRKYHQQPPLPMNLPCLGVVGQNSDFDRPLYRYCTSIPVDQLNSIILSPSSYSGNNNNNNNNHTHAAVSPDVVNEAVRSIVHVMEGELDLSVSPDFSKEALRIFVAGDRSSVGKSSVCLGILGNLLSSGYPKSDLAYIKPATQSESTQLIERYCRHHDIRCVPVGPLVYYRGFTRAYLADETESTQTLLERCGRAVDRVARNRSIVLVDGVGFPAVGSICGTDNAQVLRACSVDATKPMGVVLVGGIGVGGAVDAYNLNATYFRNAQVHVLGGIFNKLPLDGFYSLENCREQVSRYFDRYGGDQRAWGFVPLFPNIVGPSGMDHVNEFLAIFNSHVDIEGLLRAARKVSGVSASGTIPVKRGKVENKRRPMRSRTEIESKAVNAGAQKSA